MTDAAPVAVVTGSSRGVGKGIACALGAQGWTVYVTGRGPLTDDSRLRAAADAVTGRGGTGVAVACDHAVDEEVSALFDRVEAEQGRLDLLVNNAWSGPPLGGPNRFWERPLSDWDSLIGVGLRAHYVASARAAAVMVAQGSGLIVHISSFGSRQRLHSVLYGVSKVGLDKMASDMAAELRKHGVSVVSLWPGLVQTERVLEAGIEEIAGFPIAEAETPEFVGRVVAALAADAEIGRWSGHTLVAAEVAHDYGVTEADGRQPASHREAFGGGGLFPPA